MRDLRDPRTFEDRLDSSQRLQPSSPFWKTLSRLQRNFHWKNEKLPDWQNRLQLEGTLLDFLEVWFQKKRLYYSLRLHQINDSAKKISSLRPKRRASKRHCIELISIDFHRDSQEVQNRIIGPKISGPYTSLRCLCSRRLLEERHHRHRVAKKVLQW